MMLGMVFVWLIGSIKNYISVSFIRQKFCNNLGISTRILNLPKSAKKKLKPYNKWTFCLCMHLLGGMQTEATS